MAGHFCIECGAPLQPDDQFCGSCGTPVQAAAPPPVAAPPAYAPPPAAVPVAAAAGGSKVPVPLVIGVVGALIAGGVLAWVLVSGGDDADPVAAGPGEILLEAYTDPGPDPFTVSVAAPLPAPPPTLPPVSLAPSTDTTVTPTSDEGTDTTVTPPGPGPAVAGVSGTRPGLYGGSRDIGSCDVESMIGFLQANPDKAAAFAAVQGITAVELPSYLRSLTPLVLRADTRVTNHGFRDGRATPRQAVLQAGTAVLVDQFGIPRVKCACGNPLLPPVAVPTTPVFVGTPWPGFSQTNIVNITNVNNTVINTFVVIDVVTGDPFGRTPGSVFTDTPILIDEVCDLYPELCVELGGVPVTTPTVPPTAPPTVPETRPDEPDLLTGEVQVTLRWSGSADLDLSVTDPLGERVYFGNRLVSSGGTLDVDANAACGGPEPAPTENIVWPIGAPSGRYVVEVDLWSSCDGPSSVPFTLTVLVGGQPVPLPDGGNGVVSDAQPTVEYSFEIG